MRFRDYGRYGYTVRNLDRKGPPELVTADIRFSGAFGTVTADQRAPVRILRLEGPVRERDPLVPGVAEKGPEAAARGLPAVRAAKANRRGILAAIAADQLMLNDRDGAVRTFERIELIYGREFGKRLRLFLARRGYKLR